LGGEKDHGDEVFILKTSALTVSRFFVFKSYAFSLFGGQKVKEK
jgi:hypothetical protein